MMLSVEKELGFIARDVLEYLRNLKRYGHRGRTSQEITLAFVGVISESSVFKQLERLKKARLIREVKISYNKREVIFYEAY